MPIRSRRLLVAAAIAAGLPAAGFAQTVTVANTVANGSNTSLGSAQFIDLSSPAAAALQAAAIANFNTNVNRDIVHQQGGNFGFATAQPVSPQFFPFGALVVSPNLEFTVTGRIGTATPQAFYGTAEAPGNVLNIGLGAKPPGPTELQLFDQANDLVAIASGNTADGLGSFINFTIPDGAGGTWTTEVAPAPGDTKPFNYTLHFISPAAFTSAFTTNVIGNGTHFASDHTDLGVYALNVNTGDTIELAINALGATPRPTEIELFDQNRQLVAIASGNQAGGLGSLIDFTIPDGDSGTWYTEVLLGFGDTNLSPYPYDLMIRGASGLGPVNPLPPAGVPEPTSAALLLASVLGIGWARRRLIEPYGTSTVLPVV